MHQTAGIYIHIPFCVIKCSYCDFYSVEGVKYQEGFVRAVQVEARKRAYELDSIPIQSVYFGGGTPSLLMPQEVADILNTLRDEYCFQDNVEITLECNPGDISKMEIRRIMECGVNRFSLGAQTFHSNLLKNLGRRHTADDTLRMYQYFKELGADNVSIDLIYGIPDETIDDLERDLDQIIRMDPEHVSTYHLIYEEGTPMHTDLINGTIKEVDEELSINMASMIRDKLTKAGYEQYEISNFAKPGMRSIHNSSYWQGIPYLGLGPSAHSYIHPWRSYNPSPVNQYNYQLLRGAGFIPRHYELISGEAEYEEYILTRLRTKEGISMKVIENMGHTLDRKQINEMINYGWLVKRGDHLSLTEKGITLSDTIILRLSLM